MAGGLDPVAVTIEKPISLLPSAVLIMLSSGELESRPRLYCYLEPSSKPYVRQAHGLAVYPSRLVV